EEERIRPCIEIPADGASHQRGGHQHRKQRDSATQLGDRVGGVHVDVPPAAPEADLHRIPGASRELDEEKRDEEEHPEVDPGRDPAQVVAELEAYDPGVRSCHPATSGTTSSA